MCNETPQTSLSGRGGEVSLSCEASLDNLRRLERFVLAHARTRGLEKGGEARLALVLEELFCNICAHAYAPEAGAPAAGNPARPGLMGVRIEPDAPAGLLRFVVFDRGRAFDPTGHPVPATDGSLEARVPGGLGIHLVRHMTAGLFYARVPETREDGAKGARNELTVLFPLRPENGPSGPDGG